MCQYKEHLRGVFRWKKHYVKPKMILFENNLKEDSILDISYLCMFADQWLFLENRSEYEKQIPSVI